MDLNVYSIEGEKEDSLSLDFFWQDFKINKDVIWSYIRMYRTNQRQGNASTKTRGEIAGTSAKPWRQKGTGRARAGTKKSPLWRGGGVAMGPRPRQISSALPKKVKRKAFFSSLKDKVDLGNLFLLKENSYDDVSLSKVLNFLQKIDRHRKILFIANGEERLLNSVSNLKYVQVAPWHTVNCFDIFSSSTVIIDKDRLKNIEERLKA